MITEFQDGFITKTKLNELVGGINANSEELVDINARILTADVTKTVGVGGDFTTLNLAIDWCKTLIPMSFKVDLQLMAGFIWNTQVVVGSSSLGFDLGFVTINSVDVNVNTTVSDYLYAIVGRKSIMPKWNILLVCSSINQNGIYLENNSKMEIGDGKGCVNGFNGFGIFNSEIYSSGEIKSYFNTGSSTYGRLELYDGSTIRGNIHCSNFLLLGSEYHGNSITCKNIEVSGGSITGLTSFYKEVYSDLIEIDVAKAGILHINYTNATYLDISAYESSTVSVADSLTNELRNATSNSGSRINISGITFSGTATVLYGGIISANGSTGTLSQTANTITANGIIFK